METQNSGSEIDILQKVYPNAPNDLISKVAEMLATASDYEPISRSIHTALAYTKQPRGAWLWSTLFVLKDAHSAAIQILGLRANLPVKERDHKGSIQCPQCGNAIWFQDDDPRAALRMTHGSCGTVFLAVPERPMVIV